MTRPVLPSTGATPVTHNEDRPWHRIELLHRDIQRFGTITNTLAAACELDGTIAAEASGGTEQE
jgi:hypothetical protein